MAWLSLRHTQALGRALVEIKGNEKEWSSGQFLPLLLLVLPIFTAWETFWGKY